MSISIEDVMVGKVDLSDVIEPGTERLPPVTPGEILLEEFMQPEGLSARALALALHVPANRITAIINGTRAITGDTALRLGRYFGTGPEFWMNLQKGYELDLARRAHGERVAREVRPRAA